MSARAAFKQDDVRRAVKGIEAAGQRVSRVIFSGSGFEVIVGEPEGRKGTRKNPVDELYGPQA